MNANTLHTNLPRTGWLLLLLILLPWRNSMAATVNVSSLSALQTAINNANPGDIIILANGTYTASTDIVIGKQGTSSSPITIQAQTVGGVTINGTAGFSLVSPAAYIIIKGFRFLHNASQATMASGTHHCRWTRNLFQTPGDGENLSINGNDHEVDYNTFQNKNAMGRFITVRGSGSQIAQRIRIHHNYFFNHAQQTANGAESLQFGLSGYSLSSSNSIVEHNLFEQCRGENEMISIKASAVTVRYNTIKNSTQFTLRHGNFCNAYGNYIVGSEGIRFFGDDHKIYSNHIEGCSPGIQIGNGGGEVADGDPLTSHDRPDRCLVSFNTLVNNASNITQSGRTNGLGATFITISNNIVQGGGPAASIAGPLTSSTWSGNIIWETNGDGDMPSSGYRNVNPLLARDATGSFHLQSGSPAINTASSSPSSVSTDMDGQARTSPFDVGADEVSGAAVTARMLTTSMVGQNGSETTPQPPAAPSNLTATAVSSSQINLSWSDNSNNESNFSIERSSNGGSTWSVLTTTAANATSYNNTGLAAGTTYHYRVRATNGDGNSAYSNTANATTQQVPVQSTYQAENAVISQGLVESNHTGFNGSGFVNYDNVAGSYVEWTINVANAGTYTLGIRYANASGADRPMSIAVNGTMVNSNLSFPVTAAWTSWTSRTLSANLDAGLNIVRASATTATGGPNVDQLEVAGVSPPAAPSNLTAIAVSSSQINLSWTDNASNESSFRLERSTDGGATWSLLTNPAANATSYNNTGLSAATTYQYRIRAENSGGSSAFSNTASATTPAQATNVALNKPVTASGSDTNLPAYAVDGNTTTRWSASPFPQWLEVDLGALYSISRTEIVSYLDRAYQFRVEAKTTATGTYVQVVDRTANTTPGTIAAPITNNFTAVDARYVRITVTGASGYTGTWASLLEFRVFGVPGGGGASFTTSMDDTGTQRESKSPLVTLGPNPVSDYATLQFKVIEAGPVKISVYNTTENTSTALIDDHFLAGDYRVVVDLTRLNKGVHVLRSYVNRKQSVQRIIKK